MESEEIVSSASSASHGSTYYVPGIGPSPSEVCGATAEDWNAIYDQCLSELPAYNAKMAKYGVGPVEPMPHEQYFRMLTGVLDGQETPEEISRIVGCVA